ncbi:hypothetical protein HYW19_02195 [Candidatus Woesearchaeota archaeon]|nr:hypothetical protein [Candidatus Woesearchaeota archaeon]
MKSKNIAISGLIMVVIIIIILNLVLINNLFYNNEGSEKIKPIAIEETYNLQINPADFGTRVNNRYLTFTPGATYIYEGKTEEGTERTEVYVTNNIKNVMGVDVIEVRDRVWLNDELIEDTKDWYAQDRYGNVWYFGEDSKELVNGKVVSIEGSWEAGVDGAKPGIIMRSEPKIGDAYRQEYYKGKAEDMAEVVALGVKVKVKFGSFSDCLQTRDWNPLEQGYGEYKYYCPQAGNLVYEIGIENGEGAQLISIETKKYKY